MKLRTFTTATLFSLLLLPLADAQVSRRGLQGNIPFNFQVGERALPAGEYVVSAIDSDAGAILAIRGLDQKAGKIIFFAPPTLGKSEQSTKLLFYRYGATYFLRQVWQGGGQNGNEMRLSEAERVIARQMAAVATPRNVELASVSFTRR